MSDILDTTPVRAGRHQTVHHHHYPAPPPAVVRQPSAGEQVLVDGAAIVVGMGIVFGILVLLGAAARSAEESRKTPLPNKQEG